MTFNRFPFKFSLGFLLLGTVLYFAGAQIHEHRRAKNRYNNKMIESFKAKHNDLLSRADKVCTPSKPTLFYLTPKTQSIKGYHRIVSLNGRTNIEPQVSQLEWISRDKVDWPESITLKGRILSVLAQQGKAIIYPKVATTFPEVFRGKTFILTLSYELEYPEATSGSQYQNTIKAHKEIFHVYVTANDKEDAVLADLDTLKTKNKQEDILSLMFISIGLLVFGILAFAGCLIAFMVELYTFIKKR